MNPRLLKAAIARAGDTQCELAKYLGLASSYFNGKVNGHTEFRAGEIRAIKERYNLTADEVDAIFFAEDLS